MLNGAGYNLKFVSPNGTFGSTTDYPLMTAAVRISRTATPGAVMPVNVDLFSAGVDLLGPTGFEYKPGSITVGGSVSITNIIPGSGLIPAGGSFRIQGMGFDPKTKVNLPSLLMASYKYVSPTEMEVKLAADGILDGAEIIVKNSDGSQDHYFSYLRGIPVGRSMNPLLQRTVPIFPMNPAFDALLPIAASGFTALAVQNPGQAGATLTIELRSGTSNATLSRVSFSLSAANRIQREVSEWFPGAPLAGNYLRILSDQPVQMLGLVGDAATGTVMPAPVSVVSAPAPIVLPTAAPHPSGGGN